MLSGTHEPGFEPLRQALTQVLQWKTGGGAALSVYQDGRKVFDMWGGPRDPEQNPWQERTAALAMSTTKGVASTALHMLADRGKVHYDEPVARYWPEFAENGKRDITVRQLMSHGAGLYDVRGTLRFEELLDWERAVDGLARAKPAHAPGVHHGYHALTYGHLVGELVRRISGVPFGQFVRDEIAGPLGLCDFCVGASDDAITRAARFAKPSKPNEAERMKRRTDKAKTARVLGLVERGAHAVGLPMDFERLRSAFVPRGVEGWDFSSPEVLRAESPSFNGLFTARDLSRFYAALAAGGSLDGTRLLSYETLRAATRIHVRGPDHVLVFPMQWRLGYHGVATPRGPVRGAFGHFGYGGSGAWASPHHNASFGFVVNAGAGTPVGDLRVVKLSGVALACIERRRAA